MRAAGCTIFWRLANLATASSVGIAYRFDVNRLLTEVSSLSRSRGFFGHTLNSPSDSEIGRQTTAI